MSNRLPFWDAVKPGSDCYFCNRRRRWNGKEGLFLWEETKILFRKFRYPGAFFFSVTPKPRARQRLRRRSIVASCQRCYLEGGALARLAKRISLRGHLNLKSNHSSQNGSEGRQSKRLFIFLTLSGVRRRTKWQPHRRSCHLAGQVMLLTAKQF